MAWLKGLAGKAEDFLNQIDQNAAVALQKDKKELNSTDSILTEVKWEEQRSSKKETVRDLHHPRFKPRATLADSSPLRSSIAMQNTKSKNDEDLINFLNGSDPLIADGAREQPSRGPSGNLQMTSSRPINECVQRRGPRKRGPRKHVHGGIAVTASMTLAPSLISLVSRRAIGHQSLEVITDYMAEYSRKEVQLNEANGNTSHQRSAQDDQPDTVTPILDEELQTENTMLKNELRTLNSEVAQLLQRCKSAEKENWSLQKHISSLQASHVQQTQTLKEKESEISLLQKEVQQAQKQVADVGMKLDGVQVENEKLLQSSGEQSRNLQDRLMEREEQLRAVHENQVGALQTRLTTLESENASQLSEVYQHLKRVEEDKLELQQQWERARVELDEARSQLDQYRARAQRILQDKEKLIAELRGQGSAERSTPVDDTVELELEQLRQERELLREEVSQVSTRLQASRDELQEMERRLEAGREQASHSIQLLQDSLQEERKKRQAAEEDCRTNSEELRSVREELSRQRAQLAARVREREAELTRLRAQLMQRPVSPPGTDELESRLHMLTQTLVQKQASLETVTTEKNALRLQLEKMESKHRETLALLHQLQTGVVNMNDTDDAKARVPSFLLESPFDTGMTRRVKRAYSSLDAISIRTGVFLRRYPLARILVMWYMVLLHLWVMLVLFSSTPQPQM